MLAQHGALVDVDEDAKDKGATNADALRLVDAPKHQYEGQNVRYPGCSTDETHVLQHAQRQRRKQAAPDEKRVGGQQQLMPWTHDHFLAPRLPILAGASTGGRGAIWVVSGFSTITCPTPETMASGKQVIRAKAESTRRSTFD